MMDKDTKAYFESQLVAQNFAQNSVEAACTGLWHWDLESQHINWSNSLKTILGLCRLAGKSAELARFNASRRPEITVTKIKSYLAKQSDAYNHVYRIKHADGSYRRVRSQGKAAWNDERKAILIAGTIIDGTDSMTI